MPRTRIQYENCDDAWRRHLLIIMWAGDNFSRNALQYICKHKILFVYTGTLDTCFNRDIVCALSSVIDPLITFVWLLAQTERRIGRHTAFVRFGLAASSFICGIRGIHKCTRTRGLKMPLCECMRVCVYVHAYVFAKRNFKQIY